MEEFIDVLAKYFHIIGRSKQLVKLLVSKQVKAIEALSFLLKIVG